MRYLGIVVLTFFLHLLLKLNWISTLIVGGYLLVALYLHQKRLEQQMMQKKRFYEAVYYMDAVLYAFLRGQKLDLALKSVADSLEEGNLKNCVEKAYEHIALTFDNSEVSKDALCMIEADYPCKRISAIHNFMLHVEEFGGTIEETIMLLLQDKNCYESRIQKAMDERKKAFREVVLSIAASLLICGMVLYIPIGNLDISKNILVQMLSVLIIVLDDFILLRAQKYLCCDWLTIDLIDKQEDYEKKMAEYLNYQWEKQKRLSLILAIGAGMVTLICLLQRKQWLACMMLGMLLVFANQHKIGHQLLRRSLTKHIQSVFPNWLMDMVLLLQSENVQVAIEKSIDKAPRVLYDQLELLTVRLSMDPESARPYHEFLKEFQLPEITATMGMLYALSAGNSSNGKRQIADLIDKNLKMQDLAEENRMKDKNSGMYLLFLAPVLSASLKLITDMAVFMMSFLSSSIW